jgi:hypothetical protein
MTKKGDASVDPAGWVESSGGPLVMLPSRLASAWEGSKTNEYADACAVDDYVGVVARRWGKVIVLNDEPLRTTVLRTASGVVVVRWMYAPSADELLARATLFEADSAPVVERCSAVFGDEPYWIIDGARPGGSAPCVEFAPPAGAGEILTQVVRDVDVGFVIHRFEIPGASR